MNTLDFVASVVKSLSWPLFIIVALLIFRGKISNILTSLSEFSITKDGFTGKFDRALRDVSLDVTEIKAESAAKLSPDIRQKLENITQTSGNVAKMVAAWQAIEGAVRRKLTLRGTDSSAMSTSRLLQAALSQNVITDVQLRSLSGLNVMRNLAVHGRADEVDDRRTQEFLVLADAMKTVLEITGD